MNELALCSGVAMLSEGVRAAFEHLGLQHRTVCHVEREAPAAAQLVALMEAGCLDQAPVWSDLLTFDAAAWRGKVDCVTAGFPCQDMSIAGRRAGLNAGTRSGLFFEVVRIADACGAWLLILENVAGIHSATASVVDEEEGDLEERAVARVVGELADRGWDAEWLTLSASDVGASHGRERWFCIAWRVADTGRGGARGREHIAGTSGRATEHQPCVETVDDSGRMQRRAGQGLHQGQRSEGPGAACTCGAGNAVADTDDFRSEHQWGQGGQQGPQQREGAVRCLDAVADTSSARLPQRISGGGFVMERMNQTRGQTLSFVAAHSSPQAPPIPDGEESSPAGPGSRQRLNPAFGCWLMNWPCWWTNPGITSSARSEMALYRCRQRALLSSLLGEQGSSED